MIKAVIFDMDGVISDTSKLHATQELKILSRFGINISMEELIKRYSGVRTKKFFKELLDGIGAEYDLAELMHEKWTGMLEMSKKHVPEIPGAISLINEAKKAGLKIAVASGSDKNYVLTVLKTLGVQDLFDAITSSEEVKNGKPEPDVFLLAAKRMSVAPENCIVIEDGISGMIAAKKAGMLSIGLVKDRNDESYPADIRVESLNEINLKVLMNRK